MRRIIPDAAKYANGNVTDDYVKVNYQLPTASGYVKKLGYDARYPWVRLPAEGGCDDDDVLRGLLLQPG